MAQHTAFSVGIQTELPTLSRLGLASIANKEVDFPSFSAHQHAEPSRDLYTKPLESFPHDYSINTGRPHLEEIPFPNKLFKQYEYTEPLPKRVKNVGYFDDIQKQISPKQVGSKVGYEPTSACMVESHPSKFSLDQYGKEFPPLPSMHRHQSLNSGMSTTMYDRYTYAEAESGTQKQRMLEEPSEWDIPRRCSSHEEHVPPPTFPYTPGDCHERAVESEYRRSHECGGLAERDSSRVADVYNKSYPIEYWGRTSACSSRYSPPQRSTVSSGLERVAENSKILRQFAMDFGYVPWYYRQPISPPDRLLKQMTNYTYDILQALMSLRSESLRADLDLEGDVEREESEEESPKSEDEDMKYIRDKRNLLSNSKSKYRKRARNGSSQPRRCHACNTTETPEWRRGPDGARTLCNACGLHYAKLTRKRTMAAAEASEDKDE
ncbi:hypothetical protein K493DRAFT_406832 [Basidiobolus meristosporus CBS 931.73]|uniref:GATA-type domain-containing protein n=1 Tax=Basidiobolus meristosporus CBS 931.73 TaxID=1314790 RepID=A0A1Y1YIM6_9FUNG|nr:hypothetical protein K493DRAFT_406832 [Basidiobolus meristosporus CBS 931.73]|eukprot:ORX97713.1 hypothetical protein K493DRAFT_406832 [Basidiobolus meristosporus CBS 931.73]